MRNWMKILATMTVLSFSSTALAQTGITLPTDMPVAGWVLIVVWFYAMLRLFFGIDIWGGWGN